MICFHHYLGRPPPNSTQYLVTPDRRYIEVELTIGSTRWREISQDECRRRTKHYLDHGGDANRWRKVFDLENSTGLDGGLEVYVGFEPPEPATASATVKKPKRSTELGDDQPTLRLLSVFTNGLADERIKDASNVVANDRLSSNEKLIKIDELISIPATASAQQLGDMLGVSKQAVMKGDWWDKNRKGEKDDVIGKREAQHRKRAKQHQPNRKGDDDD